jgi:hypothetical protein
MFFFQDSKRESRLSFLAFRGMWMENLSRLGSGYNAAGNYRQLLPLSGQQWQPPQLWLARYLLVYHQYTRTRRTKERECQIFTVDSV